MLYQFELVLLVVGILVAYASMMLYGRVKRYYRKEKRLTEVEEQYERLRNSRRDFLQHMYWAESNGERDRAKRLEEDIIKLDDELVTLKEQFDLISAGQEIPLKSVPAKIN